METFHVQETSPWVHVLAAASASGASNTVTNPIWLVKTRIQLQAGSIGSRGLATATAGTATAGTANNASYLSYPDAISRIYKEEGLAGFFKGLAASYWGISEAIVQFVVYERLKSHLKNRHVAEQRAQGNQDPNLDEVSLKMYEYFGSAAIGKLIASTITYPHEVVRTRMREERTKGADRMYRGMIQSLILIAKQEGRRGLYAGMMVHLMRVVPNTAIMFVTYETSVRFFNSRFNSKDA